MGTNNFTDYSLTPVAQSVAARFDQYFNGLVNDVVPRNSSGVPTANAGKMGTQTYPWAEGNFTAINIGGSPFDPLNLLTDKNQINSGAVRSGSEQPLFLQADGSTNELTILATTTDLKLTIGGVAVTFDTDVTISSLTTAPSTNNTCLINDTNLSDQEFTKHITNITYDTAGSEITALDGEFAAFSVGSTEYFIAKVDNTNNVLKVYQRGFFFDSSNAPIKPVTLANNDTITLMKLAWIYADNSGSSASVGYTTPTYSASQPTSAVLNDYWFDLANEQWKRYDGSAWQIVNRILIGYAVIDSSNCVAARCVDFSRDYNRANSILIEKLSDSTVGSQSNFENYISVYGKNFFYNGQIVWDMTSDLESGVIESSDTTYYFYITNEGAVKISDIRPIFKRNLRGSYHPFHTWRWVGTADNDSSSDLESAYKDYVGGVDIITATGNTLKMKPDYTEISRIKVTLIGGGGAGGGGSSYGHAAAQCIGYFNLKNLNYFDIDVGAAGVSGGAGGNSTFNGIMTAQGGIAAGLSPNTASASGGDININAFERKNNQGGNTILGNGGVAAAGVGYGSGGGVTNLSGASGICLIEYIG